MHEEDFFSSCTLKTSPQFFELDTKCTMSERGSSTSALLLPPIDSVASFPDTRNIAIDPSSSSNTTGSIQNASDHLQVSNNSGVASDTDDAIDQDDDISGQQKVEDQLNRPYTHRLSFASCWLWEVLACLISIACLIAIVGTLIYEDGKLLDTCE